MKKFGLNSPRGDKYVVLKKGLIVMKFILILILISTLNLLATGTYSQTARVSLKLNQTSVKQVLKEIERSSEFYFLYNNDLIDVERKVDIRADNEQINSILDRLFTNQEVKYTVYDRQIVISPVDMPLPQSAQRKVTGKVTDSSGASLPGVSVVVKGTTTGVITDIEGNYSLTNIPESATLQFSFVGMRSQEKFVGKEATINVILEEETIALDEVVAIGFGTMKKKDITGSVVRADLSTFEGSPNKTILESLKGNIPGLNIGQTVRSGEAPSMLVRGRATLAGSSYPLIVLDGTIFRGNIVDINPSDIESVDILKDASASSVYGSQATNGVLLITTKTRSKKAGKPIIAYSSSYSFNRPVKELRPNSLEDFEIQAEAEDLYYSRTVESGYLQRNPSWNIKRTFTENSQITAYDAGLSSNWYDLLTNDHMYTQEHNLSIANNRESVNYFFSLGYYDQKGYMVNEGYNRTNVRLNLDNSIRDWLMIGVHSFITLSDYSGAGADPWDRYHQPYAVDEVNGVRNNYINSGYVNPIRKTQRDYSNKRLTFNGDLYAKIDIPFIKGLSDKINFSISSGSTRLYQFMDYLNALKGKGSKEVSFFNALTINNTLSYVRNFNNIHDINVTYVIGSERTGGEYTTAEANNFINNVLGYNSLQAGEATLQKAISSASKDASLYNMGRIVYGFKERYIFTGTIRRDGYSGFGEKNRFGLFPSMGIAWRVGKESFISDKKSWVNELKIRASYGSVGNRTIGVYQTLARVTGDYSYMDMSHSALYTQRFTSLESPNLKWEKTTGLNFGVDFGILSQRLTGSVDYYNNNTFDLFYQVDIPAISRYTKFPDNLGKIHNNGLELNITSVNLKGSNFEWLSTLTFFRNRNKLKELLGYDLNGDGKEDDLISEGLFIGESIDAVYTYEIDGKYQVGDVISAGQALGANKPVDQNGDGIINPADDKKIIGYTSPKYTFSINNSIRYKKWNLDFYIFSIQGGKNYYLGPDNYYDFGIKGGTTFWFNFPKGIDYWMPENPNGRYECPDIRKVSSGLAGQMYTPRSFVRLENINLSYNLPVNLIERLGLQSAKIYLNGKNLLTFTKWNGWDPETNQTITTTGLPVIKSYTIGVNVEF